MILANPDLPKLTKNEQEMETIIQGANSTIYR